MNFVKSVKKLLPVLAVIVLALALWAGVTPPVSVCAGAATASNLGAYDYKVNKYDINMEVSEDCSVAVTETIAVTLMGYDSHGIIRDLPLGHNVRYRDISAACDYEDFEYYTQNDDTDFLSVYMRSTGRASVGSKRTYTLNYIMLLPSVKDGYLPLDVVGYGMSSALYNVTATVTLPATPEKHIIYLGPYGSRENACDVKESWSGNVVTLTAEELPFMFYGDSFEGNFSGITLDLQFANGVLKSGFDFTIIYALLFAAALLVASVLVKVFVCRNPLMTATVNFTAPDEMDPLKMGKYIDNSVDSEDIGAMVFWFAEQGYLKIDLSENDEDPTLIRTEKTLSDDAPVYQRVLLDGLFEKGNPVRTSDLTNRYYKSAAAATQNVNDLSKGFYNGKSKLFIGVFALLTVLLFGGFAFFYTRATVISDYSYWFLFAGCAVIYFIAAVSSGFAAQREYKWSSAKKWTTRIAGILIGLLLGLVSMLIPSPAFGYATGYILCAASALVGGISGAFLCRTKEYSDTLGQIVGFKNFITVTEKDKIKYMLEENPELYYHILPYAQVLGVSDIWTDKFKGLNMQPPSYLYYNSGDFVFDFLIWNSMFRAMNSNFAKTMMSRPSSSGNGHIGGGFGGGFGGGGFGGGGMRGC